MQILIPHNGKYLNNLCISNVIGEKQKSSIICSVWLNVFKIGNSLCYPEMSDKVYQVVSFDFEKIQS